MATTMDIQGLAAALKAAPLTAAEILALAPTAYLCQNPAIAIQQLRSVGYTVETTTGAAGLPSFQITA